MAMKNCLVVFLLFLFIFSILDAREYYVNHVKTMKYHEVTEFVKNLKLNKNNINIDYNQDSDYDFYVEWKEIIEIDIN